MMPDPMAAVSNCENEEQGNLVFVGLSPAYMKLKQEKDLAGVAVAMSAGVSGMRTSGPWSRHCLADIRGLLLTGS
ncbi:UNVERIFIED_CONTAM: hypothetical protein K2H54_019940 [Gekko kuhli]